MVSTVMVTGAILVPVLFVVFLWLRRRRRTPMQSAERALRRLRKDGDRPRATGGAQPIKTDTHTASNLNEIGGGGPW